MVPALTNISARGATTWSRNSRTSGAQSRERSHSPHGAAVTVATYVTTGLCAALILVTASALLVAVVTIWVPQPDCGG